MLQVSGSEVEEKVTHHKVSSLYYFFFNALDLHLDMQELQQVKMEFREKRKNTKMGQTHMFGSDSTKPKVLPDYKSKWNLGEKNTQTKWAESHKFRSNLEG